jgi:MoxR-like ATPase
MRLIIAECASTSSKTTLPHAKLFREWRAPVKYRKMSVFPAPFLQHPPPMKSSIPASIDETQKLLTSADYVADRSIATSVFLALTMKRPLFLEGEAGVGKTEIAKVLANSLGRELIRLQCYEGLDIGQAAYEWNYSRQMIEIRLSEASGEKSKDKLAADIFSERFLIKRPLARALEGKPGKAPVLLIDELDRTDEPFEAYLLEVLSDFQITIPETGTLKAVEPPIVVMTSNRTREIHDAVKRRCLYHWVDYPDAARELEILRRKAPKAAENLSREIVAFVQRLRGVDLYKLPGVAETIDWANAMVALDKIALDPQTVNDTLGVLLKYQDDMERIVGEEAVRLTAEAKSAAAAA